VPNTLAHIGIQGLASRRIVRGADARWIFLGCLLPDVPWILQRLVRLAVPGADPYDLRLYAIVQGTLAFSLLLALALALLATSPGRSFLLLGLNALLHLLLDACQVKWANGAHLLAPFDWRLTNFGLFWPESVPTVALTLLGAIVAVAFRRTRGRGEGARRPAPAWRPAAWRVTLAAVLIALYLGLPPRLFDGPLSTDSHYVATLRARAERPGRAIEVDRGHFVPGPGGGRFITFAGEAIGVEGVDEREPAIVSIRGRFVAPDRIRVDAYHVHSPLRDVASYIGLAIVALYWVVPRPRPRDRPA